MNPDVHSSHAIDGNAFRLVVGHLASGVTVLTTSHDGQKYGMTASSVTSLSADPPMMLACVNAAVPTEKAISDSGRFIINVLAEGQGDLARRFATPSADKFAGVALRAEAPDSPGPILDAALAWLVCSVERRLSGGTHSIFIGAVTEAHAGIGHPLTYFRGQFGRFTLDSDQSAYRDLLSAIMRRELEGDGPGLTTKRLAARYRHDETSIFYALARLESDGLVTRDRAYGYRIAPISRSTADEIFDARAALIIGALVACRRTGVSDGLRAAEAYFQSMAQYIDDDHFTDFDRYVDLNRAFYRHVVELAGNAALTSAYDQLAIRAAMVQSFGGTDETSRRPVEVQGELLDALASSDFDRAIAKVEEYTQMAKDRARVLWQRTSD